MSLPRIPYATQQAVLELQGKGRTPRQIEGMLGLRYGVLSSPYHVDVSEEARQVAEGRAGAEFLKKDRKREEAWRRSMRAEISGATRVTGWRPRDDLIKSRPDAAPLRSLPARKPGAA